MSVKLRSCQTSLWSATGTTIGGGVLFCGIIATGSAALGAIQVADGTTVKFVTSVQITGSASFCPTYAIAFSSAIITTVISTASYSIMFMPKP